MTSAATSAIFLPDHSQLTIVSPSPIPRGTIFITHSDPRAGTVYAKWTVHLNNPTNIAPTAQSDRIAIVDAFTCTGQPHPDAVFLLYATLTWYFHLKPPAQNDPRPGAPYLDWRVTLERVGAFAHEDALAAAEQAGIVFMLRHPTEDIYYAHCMRRTFWQLSYPYIKLPSPCLYLITNNGVRAPLRPRPARDLYRRHIPALNAVLTFRLATLDDVDLLNKWMNQPRVSRFWGEEGPSEKTEQFLRKNLGYDHSFPVIGSWEEVVVRDGRVMESGIAEPFGYFEIYWVKEDRLGQYAKADDWERGLHVLIGEEKFRGSHRVKGWLGGLIHYCFCDDPRTMTVSLEPRVDNER
jgi:RimJ/RimL family protein N-acetyltransferase